MINVNAFLLGNGIHLSTLLSIIEPYIVYRESLGQMAFKTTASQILAAALELQSDRQFEPQIAQSEWQN